MPRFVVRFGEELPPSVETALDARGVSRLPDDLSGEQPLRVLAVDARSREEALDAVVEAFDEIDFAYTYFDVHPV
jgi:hypothetical protein